MTNLEIKLNSEIVSTAGLNSEYGVLSAMVTCVKRLGEKEESVTLDISGLNSQTGERLEWINKELEQNDEVIIKISASARSDSPSVVSLEEMKKRDFEYKIKAFYRLKEELREHI